MGYHLRKRKIIDRPMQMRIVGSFVAVACLATLFQVILLNNSMLEISRSLGQTGDEVLSHTPRLLAQNVFMTLGLLCPVMVVVGVLVTHRIAGPAYRMRMHLLEIAANGVPSRPCKIRKHDELHHVCDRLNAAIDALSRPRTSAVSQETEARTAA